MSDFLANTTKFVDKLRDDLEHEREAVARERQREGRERLRPTVRHDLPPVEKATELFDQERRALARTRPLTGPVEWESRAVPRYDDAARSLADAGY